jgi:hypothetical protein
MAECTKHTKYDVLCQNAQLTFLPFGLSTFGTEGEDAKFLMDALTTRLHEQNDPVEARNKAQQFVQRVSVACMRGVSTQLLNLFHTISGTACSPPAPDVTLADHLTVVPSSNEPTDSAVPPSWDGCSLEVEW